MTKRETIHKKESITKPRAINFLPSIRSLKKSTDWETLARNLYEILSDEAQKPGNKIAERLNSLFENIPIKSELKRTPKNISGSMKHDWARLCLIIKEVYELPTNLAAAKEVVKSMKTNNIFKGTKEEEVALIKNLSKRVSELSKKIR